VDTAGLREAENEIEIEGIRRARATVAKAELILHVFDCGEVLTETDEKFLEEFSGKKRILVRNKIDLPQRLNLPGHFDKFVNVSCVTGKGIEALKEEIKHTVWSGEIKSEMLEVMINSRHQEALIRAREATQRTVEALRFGETLELAAMDLRIAVNAVGEIVGKTSNEDLLDSIFSQFCLGK
jgi:tRNA modification GTPase